MARLSLRRSLGSKKAVVPLAKLVKLLPDSEFMTNRKETLVVRSDGKVLRQSSGKNTSEYGCDNWYSGYTIYCTVDLEKNPVDVIVERLITKGWKKVIL